MIVTRVALASLLAVPRTEAQEITVLSYYNYIDPVVVAAFETESGATVKWVHYESEYDQNNILTNAAGVGFDIVMMSGDRIEANVRRDFLGRIAPERMANRHHISQRWLNAYPQAAEHCVPYAWGGYGIAYRSDLVDEPPTTWKAFLKPREQWRGRVAMTRSVRDLMGVALKSMGHDVNISEPELLSVASDLLLQQKPNVKAYDDVTVSEGSGLVSGALWLAFAHNGNALMLRRYEPRISFLFPDEGMGLWVDYWCLMKKASLSVTAIDFLDYINQPENAAKIAEYIQLATTNEAGLALTSESYRNNPNIFPPPELLERSEFYEALPPRATKIVNEIRSLVIRE